MRRQSRYNRRYAVRIRKKAGTTTRERRQLQQQLRQEAKLFGLTESEYLALVATLSKTVREQVPALNGLDVKQVSKWIQHPMFPLIVQWVSTSVSSMLADGGPTDNQDENSQQQDSRTTQSTPLKSQPQRNHSSPAQAPEQGLPAPGLPGAARTQPLPGPPPFPQAPTVPPWYYG